MHSNVYESIWFKLGVMIDTIEFYILILNLWTLALIQGHRSARKQKHLPQLTDNVFIDFDGICILLRLVGVMNLKLILFCLFSIQGI